MSKALLFRPGAPPEIYQSSALRSDLMARETQLQQILFEHPELLPIEEIDPGASKVASLCRELPLAGATGTVFLDMVGVTRRGRLVLVECKLWRNPQARREVIGQILEYAGLLRKLSYGDFSELVRRRTGLTGPNILWKIAAGPLGLDDEARFVDAVSASLADGAFDLLVVGDGIRVEVEAVRDFLEAAAGLRSRLALVELRTWTDDAGATLMVPQVALRTKVLETASSAPPHPTRSDDDEEGLPALASEAAIEGRAENRAFWQRFIEEVRFTHPDQPPVTHGNNNWVRLKMPLGYAVAFRTGDRNGRVGVFLRLRGEEGRAAYEALLADLPSIAAEAGEPVRPEWSDAKEVGDLWIDRPRAELATDDQQIAWLKQIADAFVSTFRPRLSALASSGS